MSACMTMLFYLLIDGAIGNRHIDLSNLGRDFFFWRLEDRPEFASDIGVYRFNDRLEHFSLERFQQRLNTAQYFYTELHSISVEDLSDKDRINHAILSDMLETYINGFQWREWNYLNPLNLLEGNQRNPFYFVESTPFDNRGDFENYIVRLQSMPRLFSEYIELFNEAIRLGRTSNIVSVNRVPGQIQKIIGTTVEKSIYFSPFIQILENMSIRADVRRDIRNRGRIAVNEVFHTYQRLKNYLEFVYFSHTRDGWGVGTLLGGTDYYQACLNWHLSFNMTPAEVHTLGWQEVNRIESLMKKIMVKQGYNNFTVSQYFSEHKRKKEFALPNGEAVLQAYEEIIRTRIQPTLSRLFSDLPGLPIRVVPMPTDGPKGQYSAGTADGIRPGIFYANILRPEDSPTYLMMALTLHESVPGHHLQTGYAMTADLPDFRRNREHSSKFRVPFAFPSYTAYVEGWALYAEKLGEELNLYEDDYELMGYYDSEIFRACRMVVDTGLHYYNWSREESIQYFLRYTSDSREGIVVEVDRYITWPGQATAYKVGELKINDLRRKAETELGDKFDIREFHSTVLENGPVPLWILEKLVNTWIQSRRFRLRSYSKDASLSGRASNSSGCLSPKPSVVCRCPSNIKTQCEVNFSVVAVYSPVINVYAFIMILVVSLNINC